MNLLEDVYRTNHLIEFDKPMPQIKKSSLKTVKAAKEVHQICCFGDLLVNVGKGKKKIFPDPYEFREVEEVAASGPSLPATQPRLDEGDCSCHAFVVGARSDGTERRIKRREDRLGGIQTCSC
jgi:hypothetical protein